MTVASLLKRTCVQGLPVPLASALRENELDKATVLRSFPRTPAERLTEARRLDVHLGGVEDDWFRVMCFSRTSRVMSHALSTMRMFILILPRQLQQTEQHTASEHPPASAARSKTRMKRKATNHHNRPSTS